MAPKLCDEFWHHNSKCASLSLSSMDKNPLEVNYLFLAPRRAASFKNGFLSVCLP